VLGRKKKFALASPQQVIKEEKNPGKEREPFHMVGQNVN
jgi:hypothetical protein